MKKSLNCNLAVGWLVVKDAGKVAMGFRPYSLGAPMLYLNRYSAK